MREELREQRVVGWIEKIQEVRNVLILVIGIGLFFHEFDDAIGCGFCVYPRNQVWNCCKAENVDFFCQSSEFGRASVYGASDGLACFLLKMLHRIPPVLSGNDCGGSDQFEEGPPLHFSRFLSDQLNDNPIFLRCSADWRSRCRHCSRLRSSPSTPSISML